MRDIRWALAIAGTLATVFAYGFAVGMRVL
jgi:hypothetical protein